MEKSQIRISVRGLVEFILRSGDIDNRHVQSPENAMLEGGRIHRMIQNSMGSYYHPEVSLRYQMETERYELTIEGRADGVEDRFFGMSSELAGGSIPDRKKENMTSVSEHLDAWTVAKTTTQMTTLSFIEQPVLVDEIKGTYRDLKKIKEPVLLHEAQAKCYAYIYALQNGLDNIRIRVTYCNLDTEEKKLFEKDFFFAETGRLVSGSSGPVSKVGGLHLRMERKENGVHPSACLSLSLPGGTEGTGDLCVSDYLSPAETVYRGAHRCRENALHGVSLRKSCGRT